MTRGKFDDCLPNHLPDERPPTPEQDIINLLHEVRPHIRSWPEGMPRAAQDVPAWWMGHQRPPEHVEAPRQIPVVGDGRRSNGQRWHCPYNLRVVTTLHKYIFLPHPAQRIILAAAEDGIYWRGEDCIERHPQLDGRTLFENTIFETEQLRELGLEAYVQSLRKRVRRVVGNLQAGGA